MAMVARRPGEISVPPTTFLSSMAGRWIVHREDNGEETLLIIYENGAISFVGESLELALVEGTPAGNFTLVEPSSGDELATAEMIRKEDGGQALLVKPIGGDGPAETWTKTAREDGTPKVVQRKKGCISRRWTREDQVGSPKSGSRSKKGFSLPEEDASNEPEEAPAA
eukprot:TRINITY_DN80321_c0_g1_i1.p1 TRINITY_DN80321_c0_g1~~TRINITY_DN80321_c0_g1_i1.p1  ORF type:complete len:168 (-),score=33.19 TRINITY_DN80321_c0_g1_i1:170-673(-)